ncbi:Methionyl-tRNA formyltransferase [Coemansia sp. RSA 451]|nr:Methionyl-tRNA formyltransferase [Coemansia sp. RSA 451]
MTLSVLARLSPFHRTRLTPWLCRGLQQQAAPRKGLKVLFFGTDEFSSSALTALSKGIYAENPGVAHIEVVCPPPRYKVRTIKEKTKLIWKARVSSRATNLGIHVHNTPEGGSIQNWEVPNVDLKAGYGANARFDIGVVASFGAFLPQRIIDSFPQKMINLHPSLLPKYRGPTPIQTAILNNDSHTGVTVQEVHPKRYDAGNILAQVPFELKLGMTRVDLMTQLGHLGGELAVRVLQNLEYMRKNSIVQNEEEATLTRMFTSGDAKIRWEDMTAMDVMRMHWAHFGHIAVWSFLRVKNKVLTVKMTDIELATSFDDPLEDDYLSFRPGSCLRKRKYNYVEFPCIEGGRLHVRGFTVEGKQPRDGLQFAAGYIKKNKTPCMLTLSPDCKRPTPNFVYPEEYKRPSHMAAVKLYDIPLYHSKSGLVRKLKLKAEAEEAKASEKSDESKETEESEESKASEELGETEELKETEESKEAVESETTEPNETKEPK